MQDVEQVELVDPKDCFVLSRRKLMQALAALTVGLAASPDALASPPAQFCYGVPDPAHNIVELNESTIYPLLAIWLLVTTRKEFIPDRADPTAVQQFAASVNLMPSCVQTILDTTDPKNNAHFDKVRSSWTDVVKKMAGVTTYSGGQCPFSAVPITQVARLAPHLNDQ